MTPSLNCESQEPSWLGYQSPDFHPYKDTHPPSPEVKILKRFHYYQLTLLWRTIKESPCIMTRNNPWSSPSLPMYVLYIHISDIFDKMGEGCGITLKFLLLSDCEESSVTQALHDAWERCIEVGLSPSWMEEKSISNQKSSMSEKVEKSRKQKHDYKVHKYF